jgi:uncharacterized protein YjbJ (UPF0337 family)
VVLLLADRNSAKFEECFMNKDRVEGKAKDIAGRVERQAGEWTGDSESQAKGAAKQVAGKLQNAWGKAKDAAQDGADESKSTSKPPQRDDDDDETEESLTTRRSNG